MDLEKLEEEGTLKNGYDVEVLDDIDLSDKDQIPGLKASDAMELADFTIEGARAHQSMLADEENLYWNGGLRRSQVGSTETEREDWEDFGSTLDHISSCVTNHRYAEYDNDVWFKISVSDDVVRVVCVVERSD